MLSQASLQKPFPTMAADVEVTFDGTPAPLLWVQDAQINLIVPWSLTPGGTTRVCVGRPGAEASCLTWPVAQISPAVFTVDDGFAAALNQDGTVNSVANRAAVGSFVTVFATGLGPIHPPQADGSLVGLPLPGNVLLAGVFTEGWAPFGRQIAVPLTKTYAGPAPDLAAGVSQINFRVDSAFLFCWLQVGSTSSPDFKIHLVGVQ